jgi:hypothetical protein
MKMSGQLHAPAALPSAKSSTIKLDRKLVRPQSLSVLGGDWKSLYTVLI